MTDNVVLRAEGLTKIFEDAGTKVVVLQEVFFALHAGERVAIVGSSGSGKSTFLHLLAGLERPTSGTVYWGAQAIHTLKENVRSRLRNRTLGFVYQFHHLLPELNALENVAMPLRIRGVGRKEAESRAEELLHHVGLAARLTHRPAELSGGERQRVALARALAGNPACVLADEPTGNLDRQTAANILEWIHALNRSHQTAFVLVTHDPDLAAQMDKQYRLVHGTLQPL